ncbi:RagB/SusD family nutrient uptake outer membrane protein [Chryseobacterium sp. G0240]|uniref:RagB/SusD family nutrient uptake outer membrane protein n=1 Tax=Chryseobacterium sp. G0240 TaxID=2487066 RepID=UPI000F453DCB|nr:RagB/SusD family nutrient uptake outer membrane protein [Chryseobacterium sp. G0240]ROI02518.1 RagB/SusD family nutrient uptake outer membrane protein [Chryseobacterium sp. G0240]
MKAIYIFLLFCSISGLVACKKQDEFLATKPNDALSTPKTLADLQLLLNNEELFNMMGDPVLGAIASEEFYMLTPQWKTLYNPEERNAYIWDKDIYQGKTYTSGWTDPYRQIYYVNTVLDYLPEVKYSPQEQSLYNEIKGSALFLRGYASYSLVQTFAMPYDSTTFTFSLGVPIRLSSDPNTKSIRPSIKENYDQILKDVNASVDLLPDFPDKPTHPSRWAAYALLARISLAIRDYSKAYEYADKCLKMKTVLTDYNTLSPGNYTLSTTFLNEDIYHRALTAYTIPISRVKCFINPELYAAYESNDIRREKVLYTYQNGIRFRGSYSIKTYLYSGLAVDEILLIRAETAVRTGKLLQGLKDLNELLKFRYKTGTFVPIEMNDRFLLLKRILLERRKELIHRGLRWTDLRRLNLEQPFRETLSREIDNVTYQLLPGDKKYAFPIPEGEIVLTGMPQNER